MAIDELTLEQLRSPDTFQRIEEIAHPLIFYAETRDAFNLTKKLERLLNASSLETYNPELYKQYSLLLVRLKFVALPLLPDNEVANLLKENLLKVINDENIDVENRLWAKMILTPFFPRDELRQTLNKAMRENEERLGPKALGEWINDYSRTFDFRKRTSLSPINYISQSSEARALTEQEKNILRQILYIFDKYLIITPLVDFFLAQEIYQELIKEEQAGKKRSPLPIRPFVAPKPPSTIEPKKEIRPTPLAFEKKIEKPGLFKRLFKKKEESEITEKPEIIEMPKEKTKEILEKYEKTISPYEKKRELFSTEKIKPEFEEKEIQEIKEIKPETPLPKPQYHIRTMKTDIEKAKKEPMPTLPTGQAGGRQAIPPASPASSTEGKKPIPKAPNRIVDLSKDR